MTLKIFLAGSAIALGAAMTTTPASAQRACDTNGVAGVPSLVLGPNSLSCGTIGTSGGPADEVTAVGLNLHLDTNLVTLMGSNATSLSGTFMSAFGPYTRPATSGSTAIGAYSATVGSANVALGDQATVGNIDFNDPTFDFLIVAPVTGGTAVGSHSLVAADNGTAIGESAEATAASATAVGQNATASGLGDTAIGVDATASGGQSTAFGLNAGASGNHSTALGAQATTTAADATAVGFGADATAVGAIAIGNQSTAAFANSVAIGANTSTTATNQVNVGGRTVGGVAAGAVSAVSTDAVNGSQLFATNTNVANNTTAIGALQTSDTAQNTAITSIQTINTTQATQITALQTATAGFDTRIDALEAVAFEFDEDLDRLDDRASSGTATAIALSGMTFLPGKTFNLTANVGTYRGAHAGAMQIGAMISENVAVNAGIAHGFNKRGSTGARAGFTVGW
jgi:autotransporter adhesin